MRLYYTLADYPHEMIEIECSKCGPHGRLRTARLLAEHGPNIKLPDLLVVIAQCPKWGTAWMIRARRAMRPQVGWTASRRVTAMSASMAAASSSEIEAIGRSFQRYTRPIRCSVVRVA
jgi:hypothetical protein